MPKSQARRRLTSKAIVQCVSSYYEAAVAGSDTAWKFALGNTASLVGATGTVLFGINTHLGRATFGESAGFSADAMADYQAHWALQDTRINEVLKHPAATVLNDAMLFPKRGFEESAIYNEFLVKQDAVHVLATAPTRLSHYYTILAVQGSKKRGAFDEHDRKLVANVVTHAASAMRLHDRLLAVHGKEDVFEAALASKGLAVIYLNEVGEVCEVSDAAQNILRTHPVLVVENGHLTARDPNLRVSLESLIANALTAFIRPFAPLECSLQIGGNKSEDQLQLLVLPIPVTGARMFSPLPAVAIFLSRMHREARCIEGLLGLRYGLSPAELRLIAALEAAANLSQAAEQLGLSKETARSQLKAIFSKTDCHSQLQLMRLISKLRLHSGSQRD